MLERISRKIASKMILIIVPCNCLEPQHLWEKNTSSYSFPSIQDPCNQTNQIAQHEWFHVFSLHKNCDHSQIRSKFCQRSGKNKTKFEHFAKTSAPLILRRRVRLQSGFAAQETNTKIKVFNFPKFPCFPKGNEKIRKSQDWSCIKKKNVGLGRKVLSAIQKLSGHPAVFRTSEGFQHYTHNKRRSEIVCFEHLQD